MINGKTVRRISAVLAFLLCATVLFTLTSAPAMAKAKYKLPSKVTCYKYKKGKFVKDKSESFKTKYTKKGHLKTKSYDDGEKRSIKYAYYKNGQIKQITLPGGEKFKYNKKGQLTTYLPEKSKYVYSGKRLVRYRERSDLEWRYYKYSYYSNGNIKTVADCYSSDCPASNADFIVTLNKRGLYSKKSSEGETWGSFKYSYYTKGKNKGLVKSVTEYYHNKPEQKIYFSYKGAMKTSSKAKYNTIINSTITLGVPGLEHAASSNYTEALNFF